MGILNDLFSEPRYIASSPSLSNAAELSKSCGLVGVLDGRVGGGTEIAGARGAGDRAGRSNSERATPSACLRGRFAAPQIRGLGAILDLPSRHCKLSFHHFIASSIKLLSKDCLTS